MEALTNAAVVIILQYIHKYIQSMHLKLIQHYMLIILIKKKRKNMSILTQFIKRKKIHTHAIPGQLDGLF